jgi:hypothetical protein
MNRDPRNTGDLPSVRRREWAGNASSPRFTAPLRCTAALVATLVASAVLGQVNVRGRSSPPTESTPWDSYLLMDFMPAGRTCAF